jgi:tetratricopeptide (TPR) repeat protein/predicted Ser/Thr protein kinase
VESIGKYQIQRVLGRGGMGTVYEALDPLINRKVAVKTMIPGLVENPELRTRFLREAQAAGGLRHRNIVTVYDLGEDKGQPYIAMEFIEGTDLEKVIQAKEPRGLAWKLDVLHQICEGLAYAHKNGIVHRDVKPANVRVTHDGDVKIMDFGIAQLQSSTMTKSGLVLGTVHYMSPEQIEGQKVDHRADVFSVGAIAYELISGQRPFDGESLTAVMFRVMNEAPDTKPLATEYSPALDGVILKALARDVNARYQSLDDMATDLEAVLRQAGVERAPAADDRSARVTRLIEEGQKLLAKGDPEPALALAREALAAVPTDPGARELLRVAEGEALGRRVEREISEIKNAMQRARAEGQLQKALSFSRRLLELNPDDKEVTKVTSEIEATIREREVEQLCSLALAYAGDGDVELARKIAGKIERLAPRSPRYLQLKKYLDEEAPRRAAESLVAAAQEHLAQGNLAEAKAAAEEALKAQPTHALAREIRDRAGAFLAGPAGTTRATEPKVAGKPAEAEVAPVPPAAVVAPAPRPVPPPPPTSAPAPPAASHPVRGSVPAPRAEPPGPPKAAPEAPRPAPVAPRPVVAASAPQATPPRTPQPSAPAPPAPVAHAPAPARTPTPASPVPVPVRLPAVSSAPASSGPPAPGDTRREVETLTTTALNAFVENNYPRARKAVEKALALDPSNKKARELQKILGTLG